MGCILLVTLGLLLHCRQAKATADDEDILVGRISHIEGTLLRYIEEYKDWVVTVKDSPFALDDALYAEDGAKVEIIMPNKTWLRVGENSQVQLLTLNSDTTTIDIASGLTRFYNKSRDMLIKATTPFGYVVAPAGTVFDLYVGDESLEVIAVHGSVEFIHEQSESRYEVGAGSSSLIANDKETAQGNGMVASEWDDWNEERETIWKERLRQANASANLLPETIRDQAYTLEENGRWERVFYEGAYRAMWRPTRVDPDWRPFTAGRWTLYYGDNCWIPDEPFGYITHHYGAWVFIESSARWFWMPPVADVYAGAAKSSIGLDWYPGRVGWLQSGPSLGWVPLAPDEDYYGYRHWGRRTVVISHQTAAHNDAAHYRYINEAVIIDREHFYRGSRYTPFIKHNIGRDNIISNYRPTKIINNIDVEKRRYTYNDVEVHRKPHNTVIYRIEENQHQKRDFGRLGKEGIERALMRVNAKAERVPKVELQKPALSSRLVNAENITRPFNSLVHEKKEIKPQERQRSIAQGKGRLIEKDKGWEEADRIKVTPGEKERRQKVRAESPSHPVEERVSSPERAKFQERQEPVRFEGNGQRSRWDADATGGFNKLEEKSRLNPPRAAERIEERLLGQELRQRQQIEKEKGQEQVPPAVQAQRLQNQNMPQQAMPAGKDAGRRRQNIQGEHLESQNEEPRRKPAHNVNQTQGNRLDTKDVQVPKELDLRRQNQEKQHLQQKEVQRRQEQEMMQQQQLQQQQKQSRRQPEQEDQQRQKQQRQPDDSAKMQDHAVKQKKMSREEFLLEQQKAQAPGGGG